MAVIGQKEVLVPSGTISAVTVTKNLRHPLLLQDLDVVWVPVQTLVLPPYWATLQPLDLYCV